jgi:hypothetical protein
MDSASYVLGSSGRRRHTERLTGAQAPVNQLMALRVPLRAPMMRLASAVSAG